MGKTSKGLTPPAVELSRPRPPADLTGIEGAFGSRFVPAPELVEWLGATFIAEGAPLENPDHSHLRYATIGALWTNVPNSRHGRSVVGQAERGKPQAMGKWLRARLEMQTLAWFGGEPDFVLTFHADYAAQADDAAFMALCEHELMHCGQEKDEFGAPKFLKSGMPAFCIRGHDCEEFAGIVRRYGAIDPGVQAIVEAARQKPLIAAASIAHVCGTCA